MGIRKEATAKPASRADGLGNRDPRAGASAGYAEQQAPDAEASRRAGGRRQQTSEDGGIGRDVDAKPVAASNTAPDPASKAVPDPSPPAPRDR